MKKIRLIIASMIVTAFSLTLLYLHTERLKTRKAVQAVKIKNYPLSDQSHQIETTDNPDPNFVSRETFNQDDTPPDDTPAIKSNPESEDPTPTDSQHKNVSRETFTHPPEVYAWQAKPAKEELAQINSVFEQPLPQPRPGLAAREESIRRLLKHVDSCQNTHEAYGRIRLSWMLNGNSRTASMTRLSADVVVDTDPLLVECILKMPPQTFPNHETFEWFVEYPLIF